MGPSLEEICEEIRAVIKELDDRVQGLREHERFHGEQARRGQHYEMRANITLAHRHLEDARMRLGKVLQHADNGVSIYDKEADSGQDNGAGGDIPPA